MELIDRDALILQMESDANQMEDPIAIMFTYAAINDIKHAPTVDAEPVRHGQWIPVREDWRSEPDWWKCSGCGHVAYSEHNYCPHCGAKMG